ncbi:MAG: fibronectin type III domain-containing protein [Thaumarchaeota archaeon]|nr:fibronectin type III domain-containing protein [Nitrososphaerota archaeon]
MIEQSHRKIATVFAILILCTTPTLAVYHPAYAATSTGIMIPLYSYPGSYWTQVIQVKNAYPSVPIAVIVNPNNGPGSSIDQNYVTGIQQLQAAGVIVLGYVYTHYGARSTSSVEADINAWNSWYHVNGINFDEMANTAGYESYYSGLSSYAKSLGMTLTVGNPGTSTISSYVGTVDVLDIYESSGMPSASQLQSYTFNGAYPKSNFAFIGYGVSSLPSLATITTDSNYVAWMYITDNGGSNPYNNVPSYLSTEVSLLATVDGTGGTTTTAPSAPTGLTASAASSSQINLSWTAPSSNGGSAITGYEIDRSANAGSTWTTIASNTGSTSTTYSDTGLAASTAYTYRVSAINAVGTSSPSGTATATTQAGSGGSTGGTTGSIAISGIQSTSGTVSASPYQLTLANVNAGTGSNRVLVVGVEANNNNVISVTFGGTSLTKEVSSFANNDAEFWYLVNPTGTGNVVVTMAGSTSAVVGAYSLSGVDQANPIPTSTTNHNTSPGSPTVSITTANPNSLVLDSPSIWGGVTLGSPTCTQGWDANMPSAVTGASSSISTTSAGAVTCSWTASGSGDLWDDVAIEVKASGATSTTGGTTNTVPSAPTGLTASAASSSQINLSWTAPSSNGGSAITGYEIDRSANAGSTWTTIASNTGSTSTTYSDTGLAASTAYTYRVSAINAVGTSSPSGTATATTQAGTTPAPTGGSTVSLTVSSDNLGGSQFSGMWVELHAANGTTLATGYTPVTFSVTSGVQYVVYAANYQSNVFNHWQDGTTNSSLTITPTQNTSLTAYYSTAVTLTVKSVDLSGNAFSGMWTVVKSGGNTVATGYTPFQYAAQSGNTYTITVDNYQNYVFSHWSDGSTNPTRTVTPTQDTTLVAYYST